MKKLCFCLSVLLFNILAYSQAPVANKHNKTLQLHGDKRIDPYYWLRNWQSAEVKDYLKAENDYLQKSLAATDSLLQQISNEILARYSSNDKAERYEVNGYIYYTLQSAQAQYPTYVRRDNSHIGKVQVLFDADSLTKGHTYFAISSFGIQVSPDNKLLAVSIDTTGTGTYITLFRDIANRKWLNENLSNTIGDAVFANDSKTIIYTCYDKQGRAAVVKKHSIGAMDKDEVIYYERDKSFDVYVHRTASGKYIMLYAFGGNTTECRVMNADDVNGNFILLQKREAGLEYSAVHAGDKFYILTNYKAPNCRLMQTDEHNTGKENWKEILPESTNGKLFSMRAYSKYIAIQALANGTEQIQVLNLQNGKQQTIPFNSEIHSLHFSTSPSTVTYNYYGNQLQFNYSTLTIPTTTYNYNMQTGELAQASQQQVNGYDSNMYETHRLWAEDSSGTRIPVSVVYKKGTALNGTAPLLLSGYGAYGGYDSPRFSASIISLLDRGFVYAIAHTRGGEELGHTWHEQGRRLNKINTFKDFATCAQHVVKQGYAKPSLIFAEGQSAGGLIMGYMANNYPQLFKGLVFDVPFLDVVTTMQHDSYDYSEWGNPKLKTEYEYMLSYSPYDNIKAQPYPAILVMVGYYDQYWDGAKWVAKTRAMNTGTMPILLATDFSSAHDGPSSKNEMAKQIALKYAFLLSQCGIAK